MEKIDKNPTVYVNPSQPLMASVEVSFKNLNENRLALILLLEIAI